MKNIHIIAATVFALFAITNVQAQSRHNMDSGYYGEVGYSPVDLTGTGGSATPHALRFVIGNEVNKNLGVEAMYSTTVTKDSHQGYDASYSGFGVFLKPKVTLSNSTEVFARVGILRADITASTYGSHTGTDFAYGLGIQTNISQSMYGQLDYMHSYDRDSVSAKGYALSLGMRF